MKKIFVLVIVAISLLAFSACGNEGAPIESDTSSEKNTVVSESVESQSEEIGNEKINFSQTFLFMGYNIYYPEGIGLSTTDYGKIFEYEECCIIVEAPSVAGIMLDISNVNDVPNACQEYVFNTLEGTIRALFAFEKTEQVIQTSSVVTINEIEMLRVEGVFKNIEENKEIPYVAYYFLGGPAGNRPVYVVGIGMDETASIQEFMDAFAQQIKK